MSSYIGAGPAGVLAALHAAELGARTTLVSSGEFGGMAANDGPVPVRALAYAARLMRDARQLPRYGIAESEPVLHYDRLRARVRQIVHDVGTRAALRERFDTLGVTLHECSGAARFRNSHTIETEHGLTLQADRFIICTGRRQPAPPDSGFELTRSASDVGKLIEIPPSMIVVGAGQTGVQLASMFHAFGTRVELFEAGRRILASEDEEVAGCGRRRFARVGRRVVRALRIHYVVREDRGGRAHELPHGRP
jgi:dihydrolipoamide dehydrogenase